MALAQAVECNPPPLILPVPSEEEAYEADANRFSKRGGRLRARAWVRFDWQNEWGRVAFRRLGQCYHTYRVKCDNTARAAYKQARNTQFRVWAEDPRNRSTVNGGCASAR